MPEEPTYWLEAEVRPPLTPERPSLTVNVPLPKLTFPVPESVSPLLRLMELPEAAEIVPWQLTESLMEPQPANPLPARTRHVIPRCASNRGSGKRQSPLPC